MSIGRIVVGLDGSEASGLALGWAVELGLAHGSEIIAVHAVDLPAPRPPSRHRRNTTLAAREHLHEIWRQERRDEFETWCVPLWESRVRYRTFFQVGRPSPVLIDVAQAEGADLIVVGVRGCRSLAGVLLGSVARELIRHSRKPVVIVPMEQGRRRRIRDLDAGAWLPTTVATSLALNELLQLA